MSHPVGQEILDSTAIVPGRSHWEWMERQLNHDGRKISELGKRVAEILGRSLDGIHNVTPQSSLFKAEWENERRVSVVTEDYRLATWDFDGLTRLVYWCHAYAVRMEVAPAGRYLRLTFHMRDTREGGFSRRHPSIKDAIAQIEGKVRGTVPE